MIVKSFSGKRQSYYIRKAADDTLENAKLGNIDATICAEHPKLNPHIEKMKEILASLMDIDISDVSLKATTTEKLGFTGREEGISTYAVVLIEK